MKRLYFIREHRLHGIVTGIETIKLVSSLEDKLDRLLVSFKDAKVRTSLSCVQAYCSLSSQIAILEWSEAMHDLSAISLHTYERAPQVVSPSVALEKTVIHKCPGVR